MEKTPNAGHPWMDLNPPQHMKWGRDTVPPGEAAPASRQAEGTPREGHSAEARPEGLTTHQVEEEAASLPRSPSVLPTAEAGGVRECGGTPQAPWPSQGEARTFLDAY